MRIFLKSYLAVKEPFINVISEVESVKMECLISVKTIQCGRELFTDHLTSTIFDDNINE